ncbi:hypothetical protein JI59_20645 (plasmid) [Novosphingobium pentaromativorans US6-1]|uniref:TPR repeat-containing protein n=2 Tax=Novosphingobium pentaromativorans TaxID=205844 RepID=G6EH55_9SPHN|nr:hypothetical protein JI59_20645 [Novosphingobium pentaromativorans US6-1]EHJ59344.1 hypothetical protein NSU_3676 [Novosphingobium pentaromativorans US6-1]
MASSEAAANEPAPVAMNARPSTDAEDAPVVGLEALVEQLLREGRTEEAASILEQFAKDDLHKVRMQFLKGMVALTRRDYREAINRFRVILIDHPDAVRVRLELARAFFMDKDYANADRQFRLTRAGKLPRDVLANIDAYLFAIRQSKEWSYSVNLSLAPDTNINAGPTAREVTLYGLPFELSDDARHRSGIGLAADLSVEWAPRIARNARLRMGFNGQRREYSGSRFDDMTLGTYIGPRFVSRKWDISLLGTGFQRWYAGSPYARSAGTRVDATHYLSPTFVLSASASAQWLDHQRVPAMSGPILSFGVSAFHPLNSSSALTAKIGINRQDARDAAYSNWSGYAALGYYRDLPAGFSIYIEPSLAFARYDKAVPAIGLKRSDRTLSGQVTLLNRHIVLSRFTPRLSYTFTKQDSNVPLYRFTRSRIEIGLTTNF